MRNLAYAAFLATLVMQACHAKPGDQGDLEAPAIVNMNFCRPTYPHGAMLHSENGVVKLEFTVGVKGHLVGSRIVKSSGFRDLDTAALTALIHCGFKPAHRNGLPVQASFTIDYEWRLEHGD